MKAMKKINLLIIIILVFIAFATIDYFRIKSDNFPIFAINIVNNKNNKQIFIGPLYIVKREYKEQNEKFSESSNVYFNFEKINYFAKWRAQTVELYACRCSVHSMESLFRYNI